jgi:hypothetical protein
MVALMCFLVLSSGWMGWALCIAASKPLPAPPKCDDSCFERDWTCKL